MPHGVYLLSGHEGPYALERFACAPGPAGWRYVATREDPDSGVRTGRLDVVLDAAGRALRVHVEAGGWQLRGGAVGAPGGGSVLWRRGDVEREERAAGFTGTSPVGAVAAARRLGPDPGPGQPAPVRLRLVRLGDEALATLVVDEAWSRSGTQERDGVLVQRWDVADLATGERRALSLSGDVLVQAPRVQLLELTLT